MYTIYKATNKVNGHSYIGFDCNWPYRKTAHKCAVKRGSTLVFHNALRSYGWDNFDWEVLEQSDNRDMMLQEREEFWVRHYNSHYIHGNKGYNMTFGGEATFGWVPSEETKKRISIANKGRVSPNKGKPNPKLAERNRAKTGGKVPGLLKDYRFTDPNGKKYEVKGLVDFCKTHKLNAGNMSSVSKGKLPHYKGWTSSI